MPFEVDVAEASGGGGHDPFVRGVYGHVIRCNVFVDVVASFADSDLLVETRSGL